MKISANCSSFASLFRVLQHQHNHVVGPTLLNQFSAQLLIALSRRPGIMRHHILLNFHTTHTVLRRLWEFTRDTNVTKSYLNHILFRPSLVLTSFHQVWQATEQRITATGNGSTCCADLMRITFWIEERGNKLSSQKTVSTIRLNAY